MRRFLPSLTPLLLVSAVAMGLSLSPTSPLFAQGSASAGGTRAYLIADAATGHVLAEKESGEKLQVASLTKIATATVVLDWAENGKHDLDAPLTVPAAAIAAGGVNSAGLQAGDTISVRDLLYAMMLASDNVSAETLASYVGPQLGGGSGESASTAAKAGTTSIAFVAQMNALARSLGMERTRFLNATGNDAQERPYSTAADLARLTRNALKKASFRFIVSQKERRITVSRAGLPTEQVLRNTNELLGIRNVDGVKTGQTARAGQCLIVSAEREKLVKQVGENSYDITPRRLIVIVLGSADRFREASALLERGTSLYDAWAAAGKPAGGLEKP